MTPFSAFRLWRRGASDLPPHRDRQRAARKARLRFQPQWGQIALEPRRLPAAVVWVGPDGGGGGGDWDTRSNWNTGYVPDANDDVTISQSGITVTHSLSDSSAVHSLTSAANIDISDGGLAVFAPSIINGNLTLSGANSGFNSEIFDAGNLTVNGQFTWSGGRVDGTGTLTANGGLAITGQTGDSSLEKGTLVNAGAATWSGPYSLHINSGGVLDNGVPGNSAVATFTVENDETIDDTGGSSSFGTIDNAGTFIKGTTSGNTVDDSVPFNNTGTVRVLSGKLALDGGGTSSGSFASAGGAVDFAGGVELAAGSSLTGGTISFSGGTNTVASTFTNVARLTIAESCTVAFGTDSFSTTTLTIAGTMEGSGTVSASTLDVLSSGTLDSTGSVSVGSTFNWTGGLIDGTGTLRVRPGATMVLGGANLRETLEYGQLNNYGTATWSGAGNLFFLADGAMFNNRNGASFTAENDEWIEYGGGAAPAIDNLGTFAKGASTGITTVTVRFINNGGTVDGKTGTLDLAGACLYAGGAFEASSGAVVDLAGGNQVTMTGTIVGSGSGVVAFRGGTLNVGAGGANLKFAGSVFQWSGGVINVGASTLTIGGGDTLNVSGLGEVQFTGTGSIVNQGTINQIGSGGLWIDPALRNNGTLAVHEGTVIVNGPVGGVANGTLASGTWEVFGSSSNHSTLTFLAANSAIATIGSGATVVLSGQNSTFSNISGLTANQGTLSVLGGQTFATTGHFTDSGKLILGPASTLAVNGDFTQTSTGTVTIRIGGSANEPTYGRITTGSTGTVTLAGALAVTSTVTPAMWTVFTIIDDQGNSAVDGSFTGQPEDSTLPVTVGSTTMTFEISYAGITGNDVTLTRIR